jgi:hypothetical protein
MSTQVDLLPLFMIDLVVRQYDLIRLLQQTNFLLEQKKREEAMKQREEQRVHRERAAALDPHFRLVKKASNIPDAGDGIFICMMRNECSTETEQKPHERKQEETRRSTIKLRAGTVVALYPGIVYAPTDMLAVYPHIYVDNPYLITRHDGVSYLSQLFSHQTHLCSCK